MTSQAPRTSGRLANLTVDETREVREHAATQEKLKTIIPILNDIKSRYSRELSSGIEGTEVLLALVDWEEIWAKTKNFNINEERQRWSFKRYNSNTKKWEVSSSTSSLGTNRTMLDGLVGYRLSMELGHSSAAEAALKTFAMELCPTGSFSPSTPYPLFSLGPAAQSEVEKGAPRNYTSRKNNVGYHRKAPPYVLRPYIIRLRARVQERREECDCSVLAVLKSPEILEEVMVRLGTAINCGNIEDICVSSMKNVTPIQKAGVIKKATGLLKSMTIFVSATDDAGKGGKTWGDCCEEVSIVESSV